MTFDAIAVIRNEADRLADVLATTDPTRQVPTCPAWNAVDLLWHLTEVHEFWAAILATGALTDAEVQAIDEAKAPRPDGPAELQERRRRATGALLEQLAKRSDDEPAWFWFSQGRQVGMTRRMQTHEATIHRVDAELTAGVPVTPFADDVAAASLEHVLRVMWPAGYEWVPGWATTTPAAIVELRPDGAPARLVHLDSVSGSDPEDGKQYEGTVARLAQDPTLDEALPRAIVTGSKLALALWAWGREQALEHVDDGVDGVEMTGDPEALAQLKSLLAEGHN